MFHSCRVVFANRLHLMINLVKQKLEKERIGRYNWWFRRATALRGYRWLRKFYLTSRFQVAVRLFRNRWRGKNKKVAHEAQASVSLMFCQAVGLSFGTVACTANCIKLLSPLTIQACFNLLRFCVFPVFPWGTLAFDCLFLFCVYASCSLLNEHRIRGYCHWYNICECVSVFLRT